MPIFRLPELSMLQRPLQGMEGLFPGNSWSYQLSLCASSQHSAPAQSYFLCTDGFLPIFFFLVGRREVNWVERNT